MNEKAEIDYLSIKRIKCIGFEENHYIGSPFKPGDILYADREGKFSFYQQAKIEFDPVKYPHLFRLLNWWEDRKLDDMPEYIKFCAPLPEKYNVGKVEKWEIHSDGRAIVKSDYNKVRMELSVRDEPATEEEYLNYKAKKEIMRGAMQLLPGVLMFTVPHQAIDISIIRNENSYWALYNIQKPGQPVYDQKKLIGNPMGHYVLVGTGITEEVARMIVPKLKFDIPAPDCWKNYESDFSGSVMDNAKDSLISLLRSKRIDAADQDIKYVFITLKSIKIM